MLRYVVRRGSTLVITMLALSILIFILSEVVPVDPALMILGRESTPEARAILTEQMGLNRSLPERYSIWITHFIRGDWGKSYIMGVDILPMVQRRLINSLTLAAMAL